MEEVELMKNLCVGIQPREDDNEFRKIEKVLAPFMQTFKKRKRAKTDIISDEHKDLYLKRNPKELIEHLNDLYTEKSLVGSLLNETGELLKSVTNSKCFNLYTTDYERGEITVVSESNLSNPRFQYKLPIGSKQVIIFLFIYLIRMLLNLFLYIEST